MANVPLNATSKPAAPQLNQQGYPSVGVPFQKGGLGPNRTPTGFATQYPQLVYGTGRLLPFSQLTPQQTGPVNRYTSAIHQLWPQIIGTSTNVRNTALANLIGQMNTPVEQLYAAQGAGQAAGQFSQSQDALRTSMAQRGMLGQGTMDQGQLTNQFGYLQNLGQSALGAQQQAQQRTYSQLNELMNIPQQDLQFYQAISRGTVPMESLFQNLAAKYWPTAAQGLATAVRSGVTAAAGGGGGGAGMGGAGGGFGGGGGGSLYSGLGSLYASNFGGGAPSGDTSMLGPSTGSMSGYGGTGI